MPDAQAKLLAKAFAEHRAALDPHDQWANTRLATVIGAAEAAGWPGRMTASALGMSRERLRRISKFPPAAPFSMPAYAPGADFPRAAVAAFRRHEAEVRKRRDRAERILVAVLRSAHHDAGWPYNVMAAMVGASGEWLRQISESDTDITGQESPAFDPFTRVLKERQEPPARTRLAEEDRERLRQLAEHARKATKSVALKQSLAARRASEDLSALLIRLKDLKVTWPELDEACGYKPGGARARAIRHGYAQTPPSVSRYTRTPPVVPDQQTPGLPISQLTDSHSV